MATKNEAAGPGTALARITDSYPALAGSMSDELRAAIEENLGGGMQLRMWDLERLQFPSGGVIQWMAPSDGGEMEPAGKEVEGIIVYTKPSRSYWSMGLDEGAGRVPPDCSSHDGHLGVGNPGGLCQDCGLSHFGHAGPQGWAPSTTGRKTEGDMPPPCKQQRDVFLLREGRAFPTLIVLPPTSVAVMTQWLTRITMRVKAYRDFVVKLGLAPAENQNGIKYAKLTITTVRPLTADESAAVAPYAALTKKTFSGYRDGAVEGEAVETAAG